ncbi:MAG: biopolymer transporter ExbD [Bacteroidota bacterium]
MPQTPAHHAIQAMKLLRRRRSEIPTSSMADIAFLLLIFFLVTTTINVDTGIAMVLPPDWHHEPPEVKERNMLAVQLNAAGALRIEDRPATVDDVSDWVQRHVLNCAPDTGYPCDAALAESPRRAVVSIKTSRQTAYEAYIDVLDAVWSAYHGLWDAEARAQGHPSFGQLKQADPSAAASIRKAFPAQVSVAEPDGVEATPLTSSLRAQ